MSDVHQKHLHPTTKPICFCLIDSVRFKERNMIYSFYPAVNSEIIKPVCLRLSESKVPIPGLSWFEFHFSQVSVTLRP